MPTYSYLCDACGESFEKEQRISEDPIKTCVLCGKPKAHRQIVSGNFILKGGGWYSDGYGSSKKSAQPESVAKVDKPDSGTKSESTTKSDTTSPASTPAKTESTPKSDSSGGGKGGAAKGGSPKASAAE